MFLFLEASKVETANVHQQENGSTNRVIVTQWKTPQQ